MQNWKLTLTYDGTRFHGWQIQPGGLPSIQGELQSALERIVGEKPLPQGSGRTDAGVHAIGQVASFELAAAIPPLNLRRALNRTLPPSIRVVDAEQVSDAFHARHSASAKTYEYRIFRETLCSPFLAPYVYHCSWKLDTARLNAAAAAVLGEHDFTSLAAVDADLATRVKAGNTTAPISFLTRSNVRTIFGSEWLSCADPPTPYRGGESLIYRVRGNGFLHHMVRNLVGTMLEIARGHFPADSMPEIIRAQSRSVAGPTSPAKGLFLHSVEYPADGFSLASGKAHPASVDQSTCT